MTEIQGINGDHPQRFVGCCGAYCRTCRPFIEGTCKGCKLGYDTGERDIIRAKCPMKACCFRERQHETCADCPDYATCTIISDFYAKKGYKYKKYKESVEFIRKNGYKRFFEIANTWKGAYGRLP
ncbi:MAG: DUF3795 domain-containing protein [Methanomicrobiaceae archaeon]|nr:DUF3795 domain-containing protein [Methanomicrobiaceae archaeon]